MCSQEGAKLLVKAWVELMQHLADVWVEAGIPLRGWKPAVTEPGKLLVIHGPHGRRARCEHQDFETRGRSRTRSPADMVLRPLGFTQTLGSGCPWDGHYEKAKAGAVLLHWKGYLVVREGG